MPRAGSPTHWAPHLAAPPSGRIRIPDVKSLLHILTPKSGDCKDLPLPSYNLSPTTSEKQTSNRFYAPPTTRPCTLVQEEEAALDITHMGRCVGKSYSGHIRLTPDLEVKAMHCHGRHPCMEDGAQDTIWMMTCAPLTSSEDLKVLIREGISKICPLGNVPSEYEAL